MSCRRKPSATAYSTHAQAGGVTQRTLLDERAQGGTPLQVAARVRPLLQRDVKGGTDTTADGQTKVIVPGQEPFIFSQTFYIVRKRSTVSRCAEAAHQCTAKAQFKEQGTARVDGARRTSAACKGGRRSAAARSQQTSAAQRSVAAGIPAEKRGSRSW